MATRELTELLESVAPTPRAPLDVGQIERRAHRRRRRRHVTVSGTSLLVIGLLIGLAVQIPDLRSRDTVIAGPPSSRTIPIEFGAGTATTNVRLLDGTRLRLTVPDAVGDSLAGVTFADVELHAALYADPRGRPPRGWRIEVKVGSIERLVPGGELVAVPKASRASAAIVDRPGRRFALQFGSWAVVASGDSLTDADMDALLTGVAMVEAPDGFVEYRGSLPLWLVDGPDVRLGDSQVGVSVFIGDACPQTGVTQTANGLEFHRIENPSVPGSLTELCDRANRLRIWLPTSRPLLDDEIARVRVEVLSVGRTLAAVQRGEHP